MTPDNQSSRDSLRAWRVETPLPRTFKCDVWRKIGERRKQLHYWDAFQDWLLALVERPTPALACVALVMILGGSSGYLVGARHKNHETAGLLSKYVQAVDPYQTLLPRR